MPGSASPQVLPAAPAGTEHRSEEEPQVALQAEAHRIVTKLGLLNCFSGLGEARVVGSVAVGLIVKRDIDVHVAVESGALTAAADKACHTLLDSPKVREIRITDYRQGKAALKVAIDQFPGGSGNWSIDVWLTEVPSNTGFTLVEHVLSRLTPDSRALILEVKRQLHSQGLLRDGLSCRIYEAVLDRGLASVDAVKSYLGITCPP